MRAHVNRWFVYAAALVPCACGGNREDAAQVVVDSAATATAMLSEELVRLGLLDQVARIGYTAQTVTDTAYLRASLVIDSVLTRRLRRIVAEHGWPTASAVGRHAAQAAFLIVQHSPSDGFQREALPLLESAAAAGEASGADVAMLTDRIRVHDGKPQRYGTQFRIVDEVLVAYPIEDIANLDARRAAVGLMPMSEYAQLLRGMYRGVVRWPPDSTAPPG
jgi:hypothetical protein